MSCLISIHTIEFTPKYNTDKDIENILQNSKVIFQEKNKKNVIQIREKKVKNIKFRLMQIIKNGFGTNIIKIIVDPRDFLKERQLKLTQNELDQFLKELKKELKTTLSKITIKSIFFSRIDFYADWADEEEIRNIVIKLLKKMKTNHKRKFKKGYPKGARYNGGSIRINIYDRKQRILNLILDDSECDIDYIDEILKSIPDDVIRFEVQVLNRKLNYNNSKKNNSIKKNLSNYYNRDVAESHLKQELNGILFHGDYYNGYYAEKKLKELYNQDIVNELMEFLNTISRSGMDGALEKYNQYYFKKYIKLLNGAEVNPYLIPKNQNISIIKNKLKFLA